MNNFIAEFQKSPLLISLLAATLKSSVVLVAVWAVTAFLRRRAAALRHSLWVAASASALAIILLSGALPQWKVLPATAAAVEKTAVADAASAVSFKAHITPATEPSPNTANTSAAHAAAQTAVSKPATALKPSSTELPESFKVSFEPTTQVITQPTQTSRIPGWRTFLTALWIFGIVCCLGFYAASEWKLRRLARRAATVTDAAWTGANLVAMGALGIRRKVALLSSAEIEVPLTFGILRPKILLPTDHSDWNAQRRQAVLRHELAHIARLDALTQMLSQWACALYWFNPLAWKAARAARFERELACDDFVLAAGAPASEYAGELLTMVSKLQSREEYAVALAMARRSQFEGRLLSLLNPSQERGGVTRRTTVLITLAALAIALPLAAMAPQEPRPAGANTTTDKAGNVVTRSANAPVTGVSSGTNGGFSGGVQGGVQGGLNGAVVTTSSEDPEVAPVAEGSPTPAPDGWGQLAPAAAPRADFGSGSNATPAPTGWGAVAPAATPRGGFDSLSGAPAIDPMYGITGPNAVNVNARAAIAGNPRPTPAAPEASTRAQRPAVTPPVGRQTGLECVSSPTRHNSSQVSSNDDGSTKSMVVSWSTDDCSVSLNSRGDIKFSDDFTAIQSLSQDGFVEINSRIHGDTHRLSIHPTGNNGPLEYVWWVNGNKQPFDDNARKWLANFLTELDRHSAWAVKQRFPALMKEGGVARVLDEVSYMSSDYARAVYLMTLIQQVDLKSQEQIATINAAAGLGSDYETARVLMAMAGKYPLKDDASRQAFLSALDVINSDYEHARVLMAFFDKGPIPIAMARTILSSAARLKSDYEHSRVLVEMANRGLVSADTQADFLASVNNIHSDYEHARSLLAFLQVRKSDDAAVLGVIKAAADIHSDYEAAHVLTEAANGRTLSGNMRDEYLRSAQHIRSEYERNRTLSAVGYHATSL